MNQKIELKNKSLEYYLSLRYAISLYPDPEGGYTVLIKDLPGCMSVGETLLEAMENIEEARELWIETAYECGHEIPLPTTEIEYSGSLSLRIPKSLHRNLAGHAEREGVSIEQYILAVLSKAA
ncbi:MAG: type II toxin-antitoxin system HicB family antitoxin [Microcoleus sp. PH2017_29_MFU_D_A]|uniref:type II toxin-antitoxin system HicB family antitoxin n=1 Tax=unclassified Microcoleus TaxID=2642155 RepID=UPI001E16619D|nr:MULTISPECIES: type II toxin-antitoxin system HicB family antitoxin [unclassified Microcoleus]MCC3588180.1 type II toxin-antitoxin system HicB family antitoxin [Microcoleus sp. PH2017_30_WIL_O_A]MCC3593509.1 type II toxin-antitoxin system HicB family antitoxin [Microcoleus sp. PH2017_28_MFU_U_A]MCC3605269.1 type II toxin-antitoxin system HicB family antitoxin [Microcoleus sp. PH2017_29_MFU_D_A]MCC3636275.1 type II toxin-antitoxin system HicB family antitoxin [Microcoleus sp. PH2017_37_MFU_D_B